MTTIDPNTKPRQASAASQPDTIYSTPLAQVPGFAFDQAVARVFPDMIKRSVPGYAETVAMSGIIAWPLRAARGLTCTIWAVRWVPLHWPCAMVCAPKVATLSASIIPLL